MFACTFCRWSGRNRPDVVSRSGGHLWPARTSLPFSTVHCLRSAEVNSTSNSSLLPDGNDSSKDSSTVRWVRSSHRHPKGRGGKRRTTPNSDLVSSLRAIIAAQEKLLEVKSKSEEISRREEKRGQQFSRKDQTRRGKKRTQRPKSQATQATQKSAKSPPTSTDSSAQTRPGGSGFSKPGKANTSQTLTPPKTSSSKTKSSRNNGQARVEAGMPVIIDKAANHQPMEKVLKSDRLMFQRGTVPGSIESIHASNLDITPIEGNDLPVPSLSYGLDRVLFNPGVYLLQDPRSRVFNFDPYLQRIMPVGEFDFNALTQYITSSKDEQLLNIAAKHGKKYLGSSSSMTAVLAHFHFSLSAWRPINTNMLSQGFPERLKSFTAIQRSPSAIFLRWKNGSYAIDADKEFDTANILSMLGKSMEKLLTLPKNDFERYRKTNPNQISEEERNSPESYHYSTMGDFLMRSQIDAYDPRLPGTGMFDLKTRAVVSIRMDTVNYGEGVGYQLKNLRGEFESYEREYYDMIRAAFLKYSLQVRMGRMDGIFVAYHNIERLFGFQYVSLPEMDLALHGQSDTSIGDQEFKLSLELLNKVLDRATTKFPEQSLRIHFETRETQTPFMYIFAEPVTEPEIEKIQSNTLEKIEAFEHEILGLARPSELDKSKDQSENKEGWNDIQDKLQEELENDEMSTEIADVAGEFEHGVLEGSSQSKVEATELPEQESEIDSNISNEDTESKASTAYVVESAASKDGASHADQDFLDTLTRELSAVTEQSDRELLAMTLTIRNKVNDRYVLRPNDLTSEDRWSVEYSLAEIASKPRAWSLYHACQERRKKMLQQEDTPSSDLSGSVDPRNYYVRRLRELAMAGRQWQKEQDERDSSSNSVVLDRPASNSTSVGATAAEESS